METVMGVILLFNVLFSGLPQQQLDGTNPRFNILPDTDTVHGVTMCSDWVQMSLPTDIKRHIAHYDASMTEADVDATHAFIYTMKRCPSHDMRNFASICRESTTPDAWCSTMNHLMNKHVINNQEYYDFVSGMRSKIINARYAEEEAPYREQVLPEQQPTGLIQEPVGDMPVLRYMIYLLGFIAIALSVVYLFIKRRKQDMTFQFTDTEGVNTSIASETVDSEEIESLTGEPVISDDDWD